MKRITAFALTLTFGVVSVRTAAAQSPLEFDYAATRPIQAIDLHSPLRYKPVLGVELGFVTLSRSSPDDNPFVFDQNGNTLLDAAGMQGDCGAGFDGVLNLYNLFSDCHAVDVNMRFFSNQDMSYDETIQGDQVIPVFYNGIPVQAQNDRRFEYESDLDSVEANLGFRFVPRTRFIAGFRHLRLDERFDITRIENGTTTGFFSATGNRLYGGQIGIEATPLTGDYGQLQGAVKYAFCNNNIGGNARAANPSGSPLTTEISGDSNASILDLQLGGTLFLSRSISVYGGYQGLLLEDIGTAPEQVENARLLQPQNAASVTDVDFHGASFRLVGTW